jgi:hypothetical protein
MAACALPLITVFEVSAIYCPTRACRGTARPTPTTGRRDEARLATHQTQDTHIGMGYRGDVIAAGAAKAKPLYRTALDLDVGRFHTLINVCSREGKP